VAPTPARITAADSTCSSSRTLPGQSWSTSASAASIESASVPLTMVAPRDAVPTRAELCALLARFAGNVARVADHFAKDRHQIYRWARRYDVDLDQFRPAGGAREPDDER
jgi:hypothetical protein